MNTTEGEFLGVPKLRVYIVIFRWFSLLLGVLLTGFSFARTLKPLPFPFSEQPAAVLVVLVIYEIIASLYAARWTDRKVNVYLLILVDIAIGFLLSWYYGIAFFYLAIILPVLEASLYLGFSAATLVILIVAVICMPIVILQWLNIISTGGMSSDLLFNNFKIFFITAVLFIWLFTFSTSHEEALSYQQRKVWEEKALLAQELQSNKKQLKEVFNELEERVHQLDKLHEELESSGKEVESLQKNLHEARFNAQATQQTVQQKEKELLQRSAAESEGLRKNIKLMTALVERFEKFDVTLSTDDAYIALVEYLLEFIPSQTAILFVADEPNDNRALFAEVAASPYSDYFRSFSVGMGEGAVGYVAQKLEPLKIDNASIEKEGKELTSLLTHEKSVLIAPLAIGSDVFGALYLGRPTERAYTEENLEELVAFARVASGTIKNALQFQKALSQGISDSLTGLYNPFFFQERISDEVKRARRYKNILCLLLIDIDHFSDFNKIYGREMGDQALLQVSEVLRGHTRETDVVSRLENDRFGVLLIQSNRANAILIAERIRMAIAVRAVGQDPSRGGKISVSIGLASLPQDAASKDELLEKAEMALSGSLAQGGNHTSFPA